MAVAESVQTILPVLFIGSQGIISPKYAMMLAVYTTDCSVSIRDDDCSMVIGEIGYPVGFKGVGTGRLTFLGVRKEIGFQGLGVDEIASLAIDSYP